MLSGFTALFLITAYVAARAGWHVLSIEMLFLCVCAIAIIHCSIETWRNSRQAFTLQLPIVYGQSEVTLPRDPDGVPTQLDFVFAPSDAWICGAIRVFFELPSCQRSLVGQLTLKNLQRWQLGRTTLNRLRRHTLKLPYAPDRPLLCIEFDLRRSDVSNMAISVLLEIIVFHSRNIRPLLTH